MNEKRRETEARLRAEREEQRGSLHKYTVKIELTIAVGKGQTPAQVVDYLLSGAYEQTKRGLLLDWKHLDTSGGLPLDQEDEGEGYDQGYEDGCGDAHADSHGEQ